MNLGANELVDSFALHVRGGDATVTCVAAILDALGVRAIDASSGDFFSGNTALESFQGWRRYRRRIMASDI